MQPSPVKGLTDSAPLQDQSDFTEGTAEKDGDNIYYYF